jgi:polyhydroxyalkanoate synthesis regulator phasin
VRDAVERTIAATVGSAQQTRGRAQDAVDDLVERAEASAEQVRQRVRATRPATYDDVTDLQKEIRALGRRIDELEKRTPAKRKPAAKKPAGTRKTPTSRKPAAPRKRSS